MHSAVAVHVFPLGPECAHHDAIGLAPGIEWTGEQFERVGTPQAPSGPFAFSDRLGGPVRVRAVHAASEAFAMADIRP